MHFFTETLLPYLLVYKYATVFAITFLAAVALPLPSAPTLMAAAAFAGQGYFSIAWVICIAALGNIFGDIVSYSLSRYFGKPLLYSIGLRKVLDSHKLEVVEAYFARRPAWVIFVSRFQVQATLAVNILAGLSKIPYARFFTYVVAGEVVQVLSYAAIGYFFGSNWELINALANQLSVVMSLTILFVIALFWKKIVRKLARSKAK